jgi:hypothetical protein
VTGDISFTNPGFGWANFTFSGHDVVGGVDKGTATYTDIHGSWSGTATDVVVGDGTATMTVLITSSAHPAVQNLPLSVEFTFVDGGQPGTSDSFATGGTSYLAETDPVGALLRKEAQGGRRRR